MLSETPCLHHIHEALNPGASNKDLRLVQGETSITNNKKRRVETLAGAGGCGALPAPSSLAAQPYSGSSSTSVIVSSDRSRGGVRVKTERSAAGKGRAGAE